MLISAIVIILFFCAQWGVMVWQASEWAEEGEMAEMLSCQHKQPHRRHNGPMARWHIHRNTLQKSLKIQKRTVLSLELWLHYFHVKRISSHENNKAIVDIVYRKQQKQRREKFHVVAFLSFLLFKRFENWFLSPFSRALIGCWDWCSHVEMRCRNQK